MFQEENTNVDHDKVVDIDKIVTPLVLLKLLEDNWYAKHSFLKPEKPFQELEKFLPEGMTLNDLIEISNTHEKEVLQKLKEMGLLNILKESNESSSI